jgi:peptide/nickel transport system substrate-binding protein
LRKFAAIRSVLVFCAALLLAIGVAACGNGDDGGTTRGGEITISQTSQPDALDPALAYTANAWEAMWLVYTPLLTYRHAEGDAGSELIPGLAEDLPEVSGDGKTYRLTLREGLEYSDGSPVKASDFEHAIKRALILESGGTPYFEAIAGAGAFLEEGDPEGDISGIRADDRTGEITIELVEPDGAFSNALAMEFAALVPGDTPFENMTKDPPPGVGPYEFTKSVPNREFVMERNGRFASFGIPDIPTGHLNKITTEIVPSLSKQTQDVIDNRLDYMQNPPVADLKADVLARFGSDGSEAQRYKEFTTLSTYFFFLNLRTPPFDNAKVREAVNVGVDKPALARLYAGELAPGCSFLPPGVPGYDESVDSDCPWGDPLQQPDVERARQLIREAGAEGAKVTVWGLTDDPAPKVVQAFVDQLNEIGLDAEPRILDGGVYFQAVGNAKTRAQAGFANWFADFPHPSNFFTIVDGASIQPTNSLNLGNVDDPRINDELAALKGEADLGAVTDRWVELNEYLVEKAYMVPYGYRNLATFVSDRMNFEDCTLVHPLYGNDYSSFCLKADE